MTNADSFAMAFDEIWKNYISKLSQSELDPSEKLKIALSKIEDHPFFIKSPQQAKEVAEFRIRLLNLE